MGSVCELQQRYYLFSQARGEMSHYQKVHCTFYDTCNEYDIYIKRTSLILATLKF